MTISRFGGAVSNNSTLKVEWSHKNLS
jgi:hypothetical protein